jgi:hypothetical protein
MRIKAKHIGEENIVHILQFIDSPSGEIIAICVNSAGTIFKSKTMYLDVLPLESAPQVEFKDLTRYTDKNKKK